jgi:hypothetical protein
MKASRLPLVAGAAGLAALAFAVRTGRAADNPPAQNPPPASSENARPPAPSTPAGKDGGAKADPDATPATETWDIIRDCAYDRRADFLAGLNLMAKRLDDGMRRLNAKRAGMTDAAAKDWDFAMKELISARAYLQSESSDLEKATDSTWDDAKAKVALAWERAHTAFINVEQSTTS